MVVIDHRMLQLRWQKAVNQVELSPVKNTTQLLSSMCNGRGYKPEAEYELLLNQKHE